MLTDCATRALNLLVRDQGSLGDSHVRTADFSRGQEQAKQPGCKAVGRGHPERDAGPHRWKRSSRTAVTYFRGQRLPETQYLGSRGTRSKHRAAHGCPGLTHSQAPGGLCERVLPGLAGCRGTGGRRSPGLLLHGVPAWDSQAAERRKDRTKATKAFQESSHDHHLSHVTGRGRCGRL